VLLRAQDGTYLVLFKPSTAATYKITVLVAGADAMSR
jgi:hypothetical protein